MATWIRKVNLQPEWGRAQDNEITPSQLAGVIAKKLKAIRAFQDENLDGELADIVDEFEGAAEDSDLSNDDLDDIMHRLYDWGDTSLDGEWNGKKACWIATF